MWCGGVRVGCGWGGGGRVGTECAGGVGAGLAGDGHGRHAVDEAVVRGDRDQFIGQVDVLMTQF